MRERWRRGAHGPGAKPVRGGTRFTVWAPDHEVVEVELEGGRTMRLREAGGGYHSEVVEGVGAGARYWYRPGGGERAPDPASRYQPEGPHGPSEVVDGGAYEWTDSGWPGVRVGRQVVYELHVGTFTEEGTWRAAADRLRELALLGVTMVEVMPVAEFAGRFNWGYDGVAPFAPSHRYGRPDEFRSFVDRAHGLGLSVVLDVVYNHMGPDGCYLGEYASCYFSQRHRTEWGAALNFDGAGNAGVREYVLSNVEHWISEYRVDGLRLDATQSIFDGSADHIVAAIARTARGAAGGRRVWVMAENEPQDARVVRRVEAGGWGLDAVWNDDFHHSARVAATGRAEAYYSDYRGSAQELVSSAKRGWLYQGQHYTWQGKRRGGAAFGIPASRFINYLQNHDQVANSRWGRRLHEETSPGEYRALTALLLLLPGHALLFQGQEYGASTPFLYFADHRGDLAAAVARGRREFLRQFPSLAASMPSRLVPDPADEATFRRSRLDHAGGDAHDRMRRLHRDLIRLSRDDPAFAAQDAVRVDGAVLTSRAFVLRYFEPQGDDRLLLVNLGVSQHWSPAPEPLLAPAPGRCWRMLWSSEDRAYGGEGMGEPEREDGWLLPGRAAVVLGQAPDGSAGAGDVTR